MHKQMDIPIDRDKNPYTPDNEKLFGVLTLRKPPIPFPEPDGPPWPVNCIPTGGLTEAVCEAAFAAGYRLSQIVEKMAKLNLEFSRDTSDHWESFLKNNLRAQKHYIEFARELEQLLNRFTFDLSENHNLFTFPLNDTYRFKSFASAGVPLISGSVAFQSDRATDIPVRFILKAWLTDKKIRGNSSASSNHGRSSSSIPWNRMNRGHVAEKPALRNKRTVAAPATEKK